MTRVHIAQPYVTARCLDRINEVLVRYAPDYVEFTPVGASADLIVMHVAGRWRRISWSVGQCRNDGQRYAIIQYSQKDTQRPDPYHWLDIWKDATVIWSYLDLSAYVVERGQGRHRPLRNLYYAPLGADGDVFYPRQVEKEYTVCTSGRLYTTECVKEAYRAARRLGGRIAHLGPEMNKEHMDCFQDLTDDEVATLYSKCHFVTGLRRREGFELPAAEGLLCGVRPIVFDSPHYRAWYDGLAEFILEGDRPSVIENLTKLFQQGTRPVTEEERAEAARRFHWPTLVREFWRRACGHVH